MPEAVFKLPPPDLQIEFARRLVALQKTHLQQALLDTMADLDIASVDREAARLVPADGLRRMAGLGLRAESIFALPLVLEARPTLLTYYRGVMGYSQKEFYRSGAGCGPFRKAEDVGEFGKTALAKLPLLCKYLNVHACSLLEGIADLDLDRELLRDLSLLTVGPQLRGGRNNQTGESGIGDVFNIVLASISHVELKTSRRRAELVNAAGRVVTVEVAADPDIVIAEASPGQGTRRLVAIEVKAGTDASNIHNRIGEAEKSHLKAKALGFTEFWTIVNVKLDRALAARQSPTTTHFSSLAELLQPGSAQQKDFSARIVQLTGVRAAGRRKTRAASP